MSKELIRIPEGFSSHDEFIGYCETHCGTERALFNGTQINCMIELAGSPPGYNRQDAQQWLSVHEEMETLCKLARQRIQLAKQQKPAPGQVWQHIKKGTYYLITGATNEGNTPGDDNNPPMLKYMQLWGNGREYSRKEEGWETSFLPLSGEGFKIC